MRWPGIFMPGMTVALMFSCALSAGEVPATTVFSAGQEGYHTFRIPAVCRAMDGTLLAFAEGRKASAFDSGDIDLVLKRSTDGGATWSSLQIVWDDGPNTCGNPVPIVERNSGVVVLLMTRNDGSISEKEINLGTAPPRSVWVTRSADVGAHWDTPVDISASVRQTEWRWYATGPGHGIQLKSGRLVAPANHSLNEDKLTWRSHCIYSDDFGKTWQLGGISDVMSNESTMAELPDGRLYLNMRNYRGHNRRAVSFSMDAGASWSPLHEDPALVEPVCQASVLGVPEAGELALYFSNPASTKRERLTVRKSLDLGATWTAGVLLWEGPSAYSDLVSLDGGGLGCLYERGAKHPYEEIALARMRPGSLFSLNP